MKIGTCVHLNSLEEMPQKFETLKRNGFDSCQLLAWKPELWTHENAAQLAEWLSQYGITVSAFWCGWEGPAVWDFYDGQITLGLVPPEYRQMRVETLCAGADFAKQLRISDVVTHIGLHPGESQ